MKSLFLLLSALIVFHSSHTFSQIINDLNLLIQGEPEVTLDFKEFVLKNPKIHLPDSDTEYHIRLVEPDSSIDYQILNVEIDPNVDYKLNLINPESSNEVDSENDEFIEELLRKFKQEHNPNND